MTKGFFHIRGITPRIMLNSFVIFTPLLQQKGGIRETLTLMWKQAFSCKFQLQRLAQYLRTADNLYQTVGPLIDSSHGFGTILSAPS